MFDNTKTVTFDEKVYDKILALNSQEGENVPLEEAVMAQVRTPPPPPEENSTMAINQLFMNL